MGGKNKYAVRVGRIPGIYQSWPDCEQQVRTCFLVAVTICSCCGGQSCTGTYLVIMVSLTCIRNLFSSLTFMRPEDASVL